MIFGGCARAKNRPLFSVPYSSLRASPYRYRYRLHPARHLSTIIRRVRKFLITLYRARSGIAILQHVSRRRSPRIIDLCTPLLVCDIYLSHILHLLVFFPFVRPSIGSGSDLCANTSLTVAAMTFGVAPGHLKRRKSDKNATYSMSNVRIAPLYLSFASSLSIILSYDQ
jgi:hypothetical protein